MNRPTLFLATTFAVIAIAGAYLGNQLRLQKHQNEELETRVADLETSRHAGVDQASLRPDGSDPAPARDATPADGEAALQADVPSSSPGKPSLGQSMKAALESPEGRDFARIMQRRTLEQRYPDMAKALNLSAAQVDKVLDFLAAREVEAGSLQSKLDKTRDQAAREQLLREMGEKHQAYDAELSNLLGSAYPEWQAYDQASRDRVRETYTRQGEEQMRAAITAGGSPLSDERFQSLTAALRAEEARFNKEAAGQSTRQQLQRLPELARRQAEAAAPFLDAEQLTRLRKHLDGMYGGLGGALDFGTLLGLMGDDDE